MEQDNAGGWITVNRRRARSTENRRENARWWPRGKEDWRRSLPSLFIGGLHESISKEDLRKVFSKFGRVADIFLPNQERNRGVQGTAYGFIRFFNEEEIRRMLREGNNITIKGRKLRISRAYRQKREETKITIQDQGEEDKRIRSYAQVLRGHKTTEIGDSTSYKEIRENQHPVYKGKVTEEINAQCQIDVEEETEENGWISRSLIGNLKAFYGLSEIQEDFWRNGIAVKLRTLGGGYKCCSPSQIQK